MGRPKGSVPWNKGIKTGYISGRVCPKGCDCGRHILRIRSLETRRKISKAKLGKSLPPFTEEHRRKLSEAGKGRSGNIGLVHTKKTKEIQSKRRSEFYADPKNREAQSILLTKVMADPEIRQAISERQVLQWKDPIYAKKVLSSGMRPNKSESLCLEYLNSIEPGIWQYVGDGSLIIDGRNPDFWDGGERLVEFAGSYWHDESYNITRVDFFKKHGYSCRIIWDYELMKLLDSTSDK